VNLDTVGITHGRFGMNLLRPEKGQLFFGPLDDVDRGEDVYSPLQSRSEACAACHEGIVFGVPVYETYSEWLVSPAAARGEQCQSCHMRPTGTMDNIAPGNGGLRRDPATLASHQMFPGGKAEFLKRSLQVNTRIDATSDGRCAEITIMPKPIGHRAPTGFIDRHLILVVEGWDEQGRNLDIDGPRLSILAGRFAGHAGLLFGKRLIGDDKSQPMPFWKPVLRIEDTRLLPEQEFQTRFPIAKSARKLRIQLIYRHFWEQVAIEKKWIDNEIVVHDQTIEMPNGFRIASRSE
jgi:hypothetical protein